MASRRESEHSVSLFPFLAVLVCAMGALILLLLVMTRRIRQQAELRAERERAAAVATVIDAAPQPLPAPPVLAIAPPSLPPLPPPKVVIRRRPPPQPAPPPIVVDPTYEQRRAAQLAEQQRAEEELRRSWSERIEKLSARKAGLESGLRELQQEQGRQQSQLDQLTERLATTRTDTSARSGAEADLQKSLQALAEKHASVRAEIDSVAQQLQQAQARRAAQQASQYTIVPFDARTGTTRRPIVIECRGDRLEFVSEGIMLTAHDLDGFIPHFNPLSAGVQVLADSYSRSDRGQPPYVLLVVRPEGTISFYAARMFLQPLNIPFGYELVGSDQQFTWPQTDPRLVAECRRAIDDVLSDRSRVAQLSRTSGRYEEPVRVRTGTGEFRLDEVDRMRQPGRTVQFNGMQVDRDEHTASAEAAQSAAGERRGLGLLRRGENGTSQPDSEPAPREGGVAASRETSEFAAGETSSASGGWNSGFGGGQGQKVSDPYRWRPPGGNGVAVIRDITVELTTESISVADGEPRPIDLQTETEILARHLAEGLEAQFAEWGQPPHGFYWKPQIKFVIDARSAPLSAKLTPIVKMWGLTSTLDYSSRFSRSTAPGSQTR